MCLEKFVFIYFGMNDTKRETKFNCFSGQKRKLNFNFVRFAHYQPKGSVTDSIRD